MSIDVERDIARLLGAPDDVAEAAVGAIAAHGSLEHGVLFLAVLASARWGTDACGALRKMAEGQEPPGNWSDYEQRTALEEAREEAQGVLARLDMSGLSAEAAGRVRAALSGLA